MTGPLHVAAHTNNAGAGVVGTAEPRVLCAAHRNDMFDVAKCLHIVDDGRTHVEAEDGWKIRRLDSRISTFSLKRFDQAGFFTADVSARAAMDVNINVEPRVENILAQEILGARFF